MLHYLKQLMNCGLAEVKSGNKQKKPEKASSAAVGLINTAKNDLKNSHE